MQRLPLARRIIELYIFPIIATLILLISLPSALQRVLSDGVNMYSSIDFAFWSRIFQHLLLAIMIVHQTCEPCRSCRMDCGYVAYLLQRSAMPMTYWQRLYCRE